MVLPFQVYGSWLVQIVVLVSISGRAVYGQYQGSNRIATPAAYSGILWSSSSVISIAVPGVWQLIGTDGSILLYLGYRCFYSQI